MFNPITNNSHMHVSRNEKNGEIFIMGEEVILELENYGSLLKGKKVYIPNTKRTESLAQCDAFARYLSSTSVQKKFGIKELSYSFYTNTGMFVLYTITGNTITKASFDASNDDSRLFHVYKQIDKVDVVIGNPEGSTRDDFFRYIYLSGKDYILSVSRLFCGTKIGFTALRNGDIKFGHTLPKKYYNVDKDKVEKRGDMMWITSFDNGYTPEFVDTYYDMGSYNYLRYENYDAINVECIKMIPMDCDVIMGIPVNFAPILNLEQFEIIGLAAGNSKACGFYGECGYVPHVDDRGGCAILNGERTFSRLLVRFRR